MNTAYMIEAYPLRNSNNHLSEKRLKEAALPIQIILDMLNYVIKFHEDADPDFVPPEDDKITSWIAELQIAVDDIYLMNKSKADKINRSNWRIVDELRNLHFINREVNYIIFVVNRMINELNKDPDNKKWNITEKSEIYFFKVWEEIADYLLTKQAPLINGAEKSATKKAAKIIEWLNKRGMYL